MDSKHVLIIDDEADIREATQLCLEITGQWEVSKAGNGQEGLAIAETAMPDVILLDIMMPGMDGLTILKRLQKNPKTQQIPVIILTAKAQSSEQRQFSQLNVLSVITKPYDPLTLSERIFSVLT
ncbi:response regulator [Oscillatoria sp. CS-180]|uniref:response regulator n=1 Tax=Oscillatoria sp. CS-180 TaxID=3021720 RepID=UPI00232F4049|nr:response regulator [Oscillatoria sp. CS-180]MDB9526381.1 response regulator [Oscillatoria sp. CS-180]